MNIVVILAQHQFLDLMYRSLLLCLLMSVCFFVAGCDAAARRRHKMPPNLATSGGKREELPQITRPQWMLDRVAECEASRPVNSFADKLVLLVQASRDPGPIGSDIAVHSEPISVDLGGLARRFTA